MQAQRSNRSRCHSMWLASRAVAIFTAFCLTLAALPATAQTLDRIRAAGRINLGYIADAPPFTSRSAAGMPEGYGVALCERIVDRLRMQLGGSQLAVQWVAVTIDDRLREVQQGRVDLLCTPTSVTLGRRREASFSIPVFPSGNRVVLRTDSATALREALAENPVSRPVWRGSPAAKVLEGTSIAVVTGTTSDTWLEQRRNTLQVDAEIVAVPDYRTGLQRLLAHEVDAFVGDSALVLAALDDSQRDQIVILDRLLTNEPGSLALARGDEDFRLLVDTALSQTYASDDFRQLYTMWFGEFGENTRRFFLWNTLSQ